MGGTTEQVINTYRKSKYSELVISSPGKVLEITEIPKTRIGNRKQSTSLEASERPLAFSTGIRTKKAEAQRTKSGSLFHCLDPSIRTIDSMTGNVMKAMRLVRATEYLSKGSLM